ncbi:MAG TPA: Rieske 2Fe-2S domain-containing protein [Sphingomonas sp.]|nr:Rieske 2Fe-2S domain-containing protein [Sphingomonas sp.]
MRADEIAEGTCKGLIVNGWPILLAKIAGEYRATIDRCPHAASELSTGRIRRGVVMCPLHGARFELATGRNIGGNYKSLMLFEARQEGEWIEIAVPNEQPGYEHMPVRARA